MWFKTIGDLDEPGKMEFKTVDFVMQDIGTPAHTQFENGTDLIDILEANPDLRRCRMGLIHSHNTMRTWFSPEDLDELDDNSQGTDFYLSLIVNNKFEPCARIAFRGKTVQDGFHDMFVKNTKGEWNSTRYSLKTEEIMTLFAIDIDVFVPELDSLYSDIKRYEAFQAQRKSKYGNYGAEAYGGGGYRGQFSHPDYSYDPKAGEKNSGPPNYVSERQKEIEFKEGNKEEEVSELDFLMFMTKWITTNYLFEGSLDDAVKHTSRMVQGKPDIEMYVQFTMDNLITHFENSCGQFILNEEDELAVYQRMMPKLRLFQNWPIVEALINALEEKVNEVMMELEEEKGAEDLKNSITRTERE